MTDILFTPLRLNELETLIQNSVTKALNEHQLSGNSNPDQTPEHKTLYSIKDLADFIGCSTVTAQKIKNSGRIPFRQVGRKILFDTLDVSKALEHRNRKGGAK